MKIVRKTSRLRDTPKRGKKWKAENVVENVSTLDVLVELTRSV